MSKNIKGGGYVVGTPKKTNQGQGKHSRPNHGRKKLRGQGK
jgi:hypothetical protein|tara:strand:- start:397 stop:519 length:123 start_codon:yes stop_codon:yes gene_type:complete